MQFVLTLQSLQFSMLNCSFHRWEECEAMRQLGRQLVCLKGRCREEIGEANIWKEKGAKMKGRQKSSFSGEKGKEEEQGMR